jgi:hypothetical protein
MVGADNPHRDHGVTEMILSHLGETLNGHQHFILVMRQLPTRFHTIDVVGVYTNHIKANQRLHELEEGDSQHVYYLRFYSGKVLP